MKANRDLYFDSIKFALIVLVIIGHTLEEFSNIETNRWSLTTYFSIYTFHMPLFVFISGYFTSSNKAKITNSILRIAETYFVFQCIRLCISDNWSFSNIITPQWTLWYLLSLCFWRMLVLILPFELSTRSKIYVVLLSVLLSIGMGFIPLETELSFQRTFNFFPFFLAGHLAKNTEMISYIRNQAHSICIIIVVAIILAICLFDKPLYSLLMFQSISINGIVGQIAWKTLSLGICIIMSVSIINLMPTFNNKIAKYGQYTLVFYLLHTFMIEFLKFLQLPCGYLPSLFYSLLIIVVLLVVTKIPGIDRCLTPLTTAIKIWRTK